MTLDDSTTVTCMMQHEEHLWNVSVLQRVHLSSLVDLLSTGVFFYLVRGDIELLVSSVDGFVHL
jgi:hypothetical protein